MGIDPASLVPLFTQAFANQAGLGSATAFLYRRDGLFLVSNWHVFSGRDPADGQLIIRDATEPDTLRISHHVDGKLGRFVTHDHRVKGEDGEPLWRMHPRGQDVDIAVLRIDLPPGTQAFPLNEIPAQDERMHLQIAAEIYILGFPLAIKYAGELPIWKRATVASEPEVGVRGLPHFFADTATQRGMSGSPVIMWAYGPWTDTDGAKHLETEYVRRIVGIYSARMNANDEFKAQLGIVWNRAAIDEVIDHGVSGRYELR